MQVSHIFAYLGPETLLPMTSVLAAAAGVVLMFGRNSFRFVARVLRALWSVPSRARTPMGPHVIKGPTSRVEDAPSRN